MFTYGEFANYPALTAAELFVEYAHCRRWHALNGTLRALGTRSCATYYLAFYRKSFCLSRLTNNFCLILLTSNFIKDIYLHRDILRSFSNIYNFIKRYILCARTPTKLKQGISTSRIIYFVIRSTEGTMEITCESKQYVIILPEVPNDSFANSKFL